MRIYLDERLCIMQILDTIVFGIEDREGKYDAIVKALEARALLDC